MFIIYTVLFCCLYVIDKPDLASGTSNPYKINEEQTASLECRVNDANPETNLTWKWFSTASPSNVLHNGSSFTIFNIHRNQSGSYNCTAQNSVGTSKAIQIDVEVNCKSICCFSNIILTLY